MNPCYGRVQKLALGSAGFGLPYGASNVSGPTHMDTVRAILARAASAGIDLIDTAADYGEAELIICRARAISPFQVTSKTTSLARHGLQAVLSRARLSIEQVGGPPLYGLMVHSAEDLAGEGGAALWQCLQKLKTEGLIQRVGISAYATDAPIALAKRYRPDLMQLAVSLADQRLVQGGVIVRLAEAGVEIHLRSIFLQGLLTMNPWGLPRHMIFAKPALSRIRADLDRVGIRPVKACLDFAFSLEGVTRVVVGVTSVEELDQILAAAEERGSELEWSHFAVTNLRTIDPRLWGTK